MSKKMHTLTQEERNALERAFQKSVEVIDEGEYDGPLPPPHDSLEEAQRADEYRRSRSEDVLHHVLTGADYFIATKPTDEALAEAVKSTAAHGVKLIAEQDRRAGLTTHSVGSLDPGCICFGNWRLIVKETEQLLDKKYIEERTGAEFTFIGVLHGSDDFYYAMWRKEDLRLLSCVGAIESWGFKLVGERTVTEQITDTYAEIEDLYEKLDEAKVHLQGLLDK